MQGLDIYGSVKAIDTKDDWDSNSIIYARIVYPSENVAKTRRYKVNEQTEV